jgi:hypothetical protein
MITPHGEIRRAGRALASNLFFEHDCRFSDSSIDDRRRPRQFGQDYFFSSMFQNATCSLLGEFSVLAE